MHTPPREWSPSIQWAELPSRVQNLHTHPPSPQPIVTNHHRSIHSPKLSQEGEQRVWNMFLTPVSPSRARTAQSWLWNSSLLSDVGRLSSGPHCDEVYTLRSSDFKGIFPVWSAEERDVFTAGHPGLIHTVMESNLYLSTILRYFTRVLPFYATLYLYSFTFQMAMYFLLHYI